jgi:FemAB-related protein (PEP-CTERM system-associated)
MQIQIHEQLDSTLLADIRSYLLERVAMPSVNGDHDPRWLNVLQHALDHRTFVITATVENRLVGYLPLALVTSRLFGRFLVSLPYLNLAGVVADDVATTQALISEAADLARVHDVQYLELRHGEGHLHDKLTQQRDEKVRMVLDLPTDQDTLWNNLKAKVRNQIRKGDTFDLTMHWGGMDLIDDFYNVFAINMRDLGTPVYPRKLFAEIIEAFPQTAEFAVVRHQGQAIAGALLLHDPLSESDGITQVPSASTLRQFNHTNANMWMYHHMLCRAIERGAGKFDFGRSSEDSGTFRFKKQWGAVPIPTVWQYHVRRGDINAVRPDSPKYKRRIETWQKLPVWVTRLVGPSIVRGIP